MPRAVFIIVGLTLAVSACSRDEMELINRTDFSAGIEVRAPREDLVGGCDLEFGTRFCAEEYEEIGVVDIDARENRVLAISDTITDERCINLLWLRVLTLQDVGPVNDRGTLIQLPTVVELEEGPGVLHGVAFPQATVRLDEVGNSDTNQAEPPPTCAELGREPL